jgi:hypothetical protein
MSNGAGIFSSISKHFSLITSSADAPLPPAVLGNKLSIVSHCLVVLLMLLLI